MSKKKEPSKEVQEVITLGFKSSSASKKRLAGLASMDMGKMMEQARAIRAARVAAEEAAEKEQTK
jgi:hypothetical protein